MKRAFSMTELQAAIAAGGAATPTQEEPLRDEKEVLISIRRSKSMGSLSTMGCGTSMDLPSLESSFSDCPTEPAQTVLPSLSSLGLSFHPSHANFQNSHGYEELKRSRGFDGCNGNFYSQPQAQMFHGRDRHQAPPPGICNVPYPSNYMGFPRPGVMNSSLPLLQEMYLHSSPASTPAMNMSRANWNLQTPYYPQPDQSSPKVKFERPDFSGWSDCDLASNEAAAAAAEADDQKHNKYCHFCQHVKVKKASSMLGCENAECARRFCEHCLQAHLSDPPLADVRIECEGRWLCPICRRRCCCSMPTCPRTHRHCKAYRYRQRRAEQAARRNEPSGGEALTADSGGGGGGGNTSSNSGGGGARGGSPAGGGKAAGLVGGGPGPPNGPVRVASDT